MDTLKFKLLEMNYQLPIVIAPIILPDDTSTTQSSTQSQEVCKQAATEGEKQ